MTRDERIEAARRVSGAAATWSLDGGGWPAVLDAALADLGGLDGLPSLIERGREWRCTGCGIAGPDAAIGEHAEGCPGVEFAPPPRRPLALRADRDRARDREPPDQDGAA